MNETNLFTVENDTLENAIKTLGIKSIWINNFKSIQSKHYQLNGKNLLLQGENGIGKTSVLEAIFFALSGKAFDGTSKYDKQEVKPIGSDNDVEVSVKIEFMKDAFTFERKLKEKYSKDGDFKGNDITILVNGAIDKNQSSAIISLQKYLGIYDLQTKFNEDPILKDVDLFELLWNANTLRKMDYKQLRAIVVDMVGEVDFKDIINENQEKYISLVDPLKRHGLDLQALKTSLRNTIFDKKNGLEIQKSVLEGVIKEYDTKANEVVDKELLEQSKIEESILQTKINRLKNSLDGSADKAIKDVDNQINEIKLKIHEQQDILRKQHEQQIAKLKDNSIDDKINDKRNELNKVRENSYDIDREISEKINELDRIKKTIDIKKQTIEINNDELEVLYNKFEKLQNPENDEKIICPHCGSVFGRSETADYKTHVETQLESINEQGQSLNEQNEALSEGIQALELDIEQKAKTILKLQNTSDTMSNQKKALEQDIQNLQIKKQENDNKLPLLDLENDVDIQKYKENIENLEIAKNDLTLDFEGTKQKTKVEIFNLTQEKEKYDGILSQETMSKSYEKSAVEKRKELDILNNKLVETNGILSLIKELEKEMYEKLDTKLVNAFGENIAFKLYKLNVSNGEYDTRMCELYVKDSHGIMVNINRINTGMFPIRATEVVHKIKEHYGIPNSFIFVDEVSSLDNGHKKLLLTYGEQVFATSVSESKIIEEKEI